MIYKWKITEKDIGKRLDVFLTNELDDLTRSAIAKRIKQGNAKINEKIASVHTFLRQDDLVFFDSELKLTTKEKQIEEKNSKKFSSLKPFIIQETDDWIVLNKPSGLLVHPDAKHKNHTLVDLLIDHYPKIVKVGENPERPGIVHRLDKKVSGLMVVAKNQHAFDELKKQFSQRKTKKTYLALIYGYLPKKEGEIRFKIARSQDKPRMAALPEHADNGKIAWTHYKVLEEKNMASKVELDIFSGRTHQIRVHLFALNHPVIGDDLYQPKNIKLIPTNRIMLQSICLQFHDLNTDELLTFTIPPLPDLQKLFESLK